MRVLMIEVDPFTYRALVQALRNTNSIVEQVDSGEEALEMARHYDYDTVVLDLMLPGMDGYEFGRRMRAARVSTPALVTSALVRPQARIKAFAVCADDFLTKPYDVAECIARMQA